MAQLIGDARNILHLYRAVVANPEHGTGHGLASHAAVVYNDCRYIQYRLQVLHAQYGQQLSVPLKGMAAFLDLAQTFSQLGHSKLTSMLVSGTLSRVLLQL